MYTGHHAYALHEYSGFVGRKSSLTVGVNSAADLTGVNLRGAKLEGARGLPTAQRLSPPRHVW